MDFILANHFRERNTELGGAHCSRESDHHFPTAIEMCDVGVGGVFQNRRVEVPEVAIDELADAVRLLLISGVQFVLLTDDAKIYGRETVDSSDQYVRH